MSDHVVNYRRFGHEEIGVSDMYAHAGRGMKPEGVVTSAPDPAQEGLRGVRRPTVGAHPDSSVSKDHPR